ncbi:hypothetical protein FIV07_27815 (plasmid) [Mycobacterium sp. THAF192]|nr:hypothetical protein FIV07_27815 [Mycobacterium sp. THAF192]
MGSRQRTPITTTRPGRKPLPPEADAWVRSAASQPPSQESTEPSTPQSPPPALSVVSDPPQQQPGPPAAADESDGDSPSGEAAPQAASEEIPPATGEAAPHGTTIKFTLDIPLDLHRAMQIQKIRSRTSIVDTVRKILSNYYRTSAEISPGVYPLKPGEPTKRSTFDLAEELVIEMDMQKVLRGAKIKDEVRQLLANHYTPGGSITD